MKRNRRNTSQRLQPRASGWAGAEGGALTGGVAGSPTANDDSEAMPQCFTRWEFAAALRVSVRTADRLIADGEVRVVRLRGWAVRIPRAEVERYLNGTKPENGEQNHQPNKKQ